MRYGFAIDQRTCIGCHACTVACKTEHEIPVGQFRTWVKYVDSGTFPDNTRDFGVMRCNHCTDAPCVAICPTHALFTRKDGIVDFDGDSCIGCKSCQQACPYDAIYIDANTHTAAKCNFCAHRVDEGLEPACVVVCPTHSIWVGDLSDPMSGISQLLAEGAVENQVAVRAPEQKTGPNVFYLGATIPVLDPLAAPVDDTYIFSQPDPHRAMVSSHLPPSADNAKTTLNTAHPRPWGWRVTTYLWTKGVAAGAVLVAALAVLFDIDLGRVGTIGAPLIGLVGAAFTGVLLISDLKRPERFYYIFTKGNRTSWLFLGSWALAIFGALLTAWLAAGLLAENSVGWAENAWKVLAVVSLPAAVMAAGYTAFLFNQAKGRDLWESRLLFPHLIAQAVMVGAGALAVTAPTVDLGDEAERLIVRCLVIATVVHIAFAVVEFYGKHETKQATTAARLVTKGPYTPMFLGSLALAFASAAVAMFAWDGGHMALAVIGGLGVQGALLMYESVFVRAGQDVPLS